MHVEGRVTLIAVFKIRLDAVVVARLKDWCHKRGAYALISASRIGSEYR
jgi:hypothetical protein